MAAIPLPLSPIQAFAPKGQHDWDAWVNENFLFLAATGQLSVHSRSASLVENPSLGAQINPTNGRVQIHFNGSWRVYTPQTGWRAFVRDEGINIVYVGSAWRQEAAVPAYRLQAPITVSGNIPEAALRAGGVLVVNSESQIDLTIPATIAGAAVPHGSSHSRQPTTIVQTGAGKVRIMAGGGVTLRTVEGANVTRAQYSAASIIPIGEDEYVLAGDLVP